MTMNAAKVEATVDGGQGYGHIPCTAPMWAEVHPEHLRHNLLEIRRRLRPGVKFMAVVKANGYGHGLVPTAAVLAEAGADAFGVGTCEEGVRLREAGIRQPILVLGPIHPAQADTAAESDLEVTVFQASWFAEMRKHRISAKPLRVHIKMDTGMGRYGLRERAEFEEMVPHLREMDIEVVGVFTHLATANQADDGYVRRQFALFQTMRRWVEEAGFGRVTAHCANSAAAIRYPELALDMVRVGASLYGILPIDRDVVEKQPLDVGLLPTISVRTVISHVKRVEAGQSVGYDRAYQTVEEEWIATVPVGYANRWFRGYSGCSVIVAGERAPIVAICMNQMMIRLPRPVPVGTPVTLLGVDGQERVLPDELAAHIGSIPQQVLVMLPEQMPRMYRDA
jgi:alanine racemase